MKSDIENFKYLFQIEDDGGIGGKYTRVELIVKLIVPNHCDIQFDLRKGKTGFFLPDHSFTFLLLLINSLNTREIKAPIYLYYRPWLEGE